jgi:hypothetical protein
MSSVLLRVLFVLFFFNAAWFKAQNNVCPTCKKEIEGNYIKVGDKSFHPDHFLCDYCKKPLPDKFMKENHKYYHIECYQELMGLKCEYCQKPINNEYLVSQNKKYHKECFDKISPKCSVCGKNLSGTISVDYYGNKYHLIHENEYTRCTSCNRLVTEALTKGGKKYSDGRSICNLCYPEAIFDNGRISGLLEKVRSSISTLGISISTSSLSVKGVSLTELKNEAGEFYSKNVKGFCSSEIYSSSKSGTKYSHTIFVLNGLPAANIESIIAHELMHVWIAQNVKKKLSSSVTEGSCNYVAYLYLKKQSDQNILKLIDEIENDPSPVYGEGFRIIKNRFSGKTVTEFLNYLRAN